MKLIITIPKEYEDDYNKDKFSELFSRITSDLDLLKVSNGFCLCGNYENETIDMLKEAFSNCEEEKQLSNENKYLNTMVECMGYELMNCEWWDRYASAYDKTIEDIILYFQYKHVNRDPYTNEDYVKNVINKLKKENEELKWYAYEFLQLPKEKRIETLQKAFEKMEDLEKQLAITDKTLDKVCKRIDEINWSSLKEHLLKESEKE